MSPPEAVKGGGQHRPPQRGESHAHLIDPEERAKGGMYSFPIAIQDGAWIGAGVILLPGVTVGRYAVVGAGSVVTRDVPDYTVAAGNPCRPIRRIDARDREYYWRDRRFDDLAL